LEKGFSSQGTAFWKDHRGQVGTQLKAGRGMGRKRGNQFLTPVKKGPKLRGKKLGEIGGLKVRKL